MQSSDVVGTDKRYNDVLPMMVEVKINPKGIPGEIFNCIAESLTRVGVRGKVGENGKPVLIQTCNILHKKGKYYICHFKTMYLLDGRENTLTMSDVARQNAIINLLVQWGLIEVVKPSMIQSPLCSMKSIKVVKHSESKDWELIAKYKIGHNKEVNV